MHKVRRLWIALKIATHIAPCRPTGASPSHDPVPSSYFAAGDTLGRPDPEEEPVPILLDPRLPRAGQNGLRTVRHNGEGPNAAQRCHVHAVVHHFEVRVRLQRGGVDRNDYGADRHRPSAGRGGGAVAQRCI